MMKSFNYLKAGLQQTKRCLTAILCLSVATLTWAADQFIHFTPQAGATLLYDGTQNISVACDDAEHEGVKITLESFAKDWQAVTGQTPTLVSSSNGASIIAGSIDKSATIKALAKQGLIDLKQLQGKTEKYIITLSPDHQIVIAGSDKRGTIYGIYELSRQLGVSPWNWWADVPVTRQQQIYVQPGVYTDGEPVVRYRGIFLNDEAPCLSGWVKEKFPDSECPSALPTANGFNHHFYGKLFELLLRLKANYLWPAMWGNAFYADDPENSRLANTMGIIMGTSHHEPMARNHQEWARHREEFGDWDYVTNRAVVDKFFREGMERAKDNEDLITIGMRGDGDTPMGAKEGHDKDFVIDDQYMINVLQGVIKGQRQIIKEVTKQKPEKRQQVWALYKEVQRFFDAGMRVPDDVLILLSDDNWGNIRRIPALAERQRKGGWGMYYHVDYVGAPRSSKWANITPIAHLWEQMNICVQYGIDRLWVLNVGDLKPMEYPIDFFLEMAWDPSKFTAETFPQHAERFCEVAFGADQGKEAARILKEYGIYNGRVTPEMLSDRTYNLQNGEFLNVMQAYKSLETDALRQFLKLRPECKDAYQQLILYPVQSMANLYEMYYALAMNRQCYAAGNPDANLWADKVEACFNRDQELTDGYHSINGGKWNHLMDQSHIGYHSWNDPPKNIMPHVERLDLSTFTPGGYTFALGKGYTAIEAEHYFEAKSQDAARWTVIPGMGRTRSAIAHMPYDAGTKEAVISYRFDLPAGLDSVKVHIVTNSTLAFERKDGHRYTLSIDGCEAKEVNYNGIYNDDNQWLTFDIVATRVIETVTSLPVNGKEDAHTLTIHPLDPGMVLEKIVIDYGGYEKQHLFGTESAVSKK